MTSEVCGTRHGVVARMAWQRGTGADETPAASARPSPRLVQPQVSLIAQTPVQAKNGKHPILVLLVAGVVQTTLVSVRVERSIGPLSHASLEILQVQGKAVTFPAVIPVIPVLVLMRLVFGQRELSIDQAVLQIREVRIGSVNTPAY